MSVFSINFSADGVAITGPPGPQGPDGAAGGDTVIDENGYLQGVSQPIKGIIMLDETGFNSYLATLDSPTGAWKTTLYFGGDTPGDSFLSEDGAYYFVSEDLQNYIAQEA